MRCPMKAEVSKSMNEWTVVTVLIALVGLFLTVGKPIISLNKNITKLDMSVERTNARLDKNERAIEKQQQAAHESHEKLWSHNSEQDSKIADHETRISVLEHK